MKPHVADLIDALPEELQQTELTSTDISLQTLLKELGGRPVPVGRMNRGRILGTLQAKIAVAYLVYWVRTSYKGVGEKQQRLNETHLKAALELLGGMSYLRGTMMKVGQMIANYPYVAPEEFAQVLGRLHFEAPPMHFSLLRELVRNELGADPEEVFDEFETKAFAAASLGQVHRGRLKGSGERVAVKIQYPGIARTIQDDFRSLKTVLFPMRLSRDWDNLQSQFDEVRRMLDAETDYLQEAENLRLARSAFQPEDEIVVPRVHSEFSTKRVLTMEHVDGVHLGKFLESKPSQKVCDRFGEKIAFAMARLWSGKHMVYADPQPGNYYFMPDGRLGLVDFGCCHHFSEDDFDYTTQMERAAQGSPELLRKALLRAADLKPTQQVDPQHMRLLEEFCHWVWKPIKHDGAFDFGQPEYFQRGVELLGEIMRQRYLRSLPVNIWLDRNFFGMRAMLFRLKARVDLGGLLRQGAASAPKAV